MKKFSDYFITKKRLNESIFYCLDESRPDFLHEFVYSVHKFFDILPSDWIYEQIADAFYELETESEENRESIISQLEPDIYYRQLEEWLREPFAFECIENAIEEWAYERGNIYNQISLGQLYAKDYIYNRVKEFLEDYEK